MRKDKCKCGKYITWDPYDSKAIVTCKYCGTDYLKDADTVLVHWLVEMQKDKPHRTDAR